MKKTVGGGLALLVLVLAVYLPVVGYDFVNYDDIQYVTDNPFVLSGLTRASVIWAFQVHGPSMWVPLTWLSHQAVVSVAGAQSAGVHHAVNVALHAAGVLMLYAFLLRVTNPGQFATLPGDDRPGPRGRPGAALSGAAAWTAAAFWAVHPLHVESVAWVTERKDVLAGACWMLTLLVYLAYVRRPGAVRYLLLLGATALALMAKPSTVTLPIVLLLLDVWPLQRVGPFRAAAGWPAVSPRRAVLEKVPLLAMAAYSSWMTVLCQSSFGALGSFEKFPLPLRVGNAVISYGAYLRHLVWPEGYAVLYPYPARIPLVPLAVSLLVLLTLSLVALLLARRQPGALTGWLWYLGVFVPMIGLVQAGQPQAMADHFAYLPAVGLYIGGTALLDGWASVSRRRQTGVFILGGVAILLLAVAARRQVAVWRNSETLFTHALAVTQENRAAGEIFGRSAVLQSQGLWFLHIHLGMAMIERGRIDEGIAELRQAQAIDPSDPLAHYHLAGAHYLQGNRDLAAKEYRATLALDPANFPSLSNLAQLEIDAGRFAEALPLLREAVSLAPSHAWVRDRLGVALVLNGQTEAGIAELRFAARLAPWDAEIREHLDRALAEQGK